MRLADAVLRQGHLSDRALTEAILTGERPAHIDRCDICSDRAVELGRWLDAVRESAFESADAVFTPEKLAAQQSQIQRRLEQLDEPRRVIAFPGQARHTQPEAGRRRVAPAWIGVAAAAGLVVGAIGGQAAARFDRVPTVTAQPAAAVPVSTPAQQPDAPTFAAATASLLEMDMDALVVPAQLGAINDITPKIQTVSLRR